MFEAVSERNILRHGEGLARKIENGEDLEAKLLGAAEWLLSQAPLDLIRMAESDMPALPEAVAARLMILLHQKMLIPLVAALESAGQSGEIDSGTDSGLVAGAFFGLIESLHATPGAFVKRGKMDMAAEFIKIVLRGIGYSKRDAS